MLALFSFVVVVASAGGGSVALLGHGHHRRLELFLAVSAGVMLGVLAGHLLPEAFEETASTAWALVGGFLFMLLVERFLLPHTLHSPHAADAHAHALEQPGGEEARAAVRAQAAGVGAFVGLSLHTIVDGFALGAAMERPGAAPYVLLGIVAHKVPSAFALGSILVRAQRRPSVVVLAAGALGAMVGLGAILFAGLRAAGQVDATELAPFAIAFSAGSFLHVVVTDLLPDLHREGAERRRLLLALLGGLALTIALSFVLHDH